MADMTTPPPDYDYDYSVPPEVLLIEDDRPVGPDDPLAASLRLLYVAAYSVALLGVPLNLAVIAAALLGRSRGGDRDRSGSGRAAVLGLAAVHLARGLLLPLSLRSALRSFSWEFGAAACKLASYVTFLQMFSASLLLTFWHAARCVPRRRCLSTGLALPPGSLPVLLGWSLGAVLAAPSLLSMELQEDAAAPGRNGTAFRCAESYDYVRMPSPSAAAVERTKAVAVSRVLFGLAVPVVVIALSRLAGRNGGGETPEPAVLWPVTVGHFVCWAPVLLLALLLATAGRAVSSPYGLPLCTVLHVFSGCVCPLLCLWKGLFLRNVVQIFE